MMKKILPIALLFLIFLLALFFRVYFCYNKVFSDPVKYSADDGVYHMRLVENELLGGHFPQHLYFEPFTYFPHATYNSVAPFYDQILSWTIWLLSLGKPTLDLINKIAPLIPAILGSLMIFVAYFIGKAIWDKKVGIFSALLMAVSSSYLFRSLLGSTDHHVAEVLFSSLTMMFLIFALKFFDKKKKFLFFILLSGFFLGIYLLTWPGGLLFVFIIFAFMILYHFIEFLTGRSESNLLLRGGAVIFLVALLIILFYFNYSFFYINVYNFKHFLSLVLGIAAFLLLDRASLFIKKRKINKWFLPVVFAAGLILFLIVSGLAFPSVLSELKTTFMAVRNGMVSNEFARDVVGEMMPLGIQGAIDNFSSLFFFFLIALGVIVYKFVKDRKPEYLLAAVWGLIILLMTGVIPFFGARRYSYYLSFNISLLASFLAVKSLEFGWKGLRTIEHNYSAKSEFRPYLLAGPVLIIFNIIFFLLFPFPFNIGASFPQVLPNIVYVPLMISRGGPYVLHQDWYDSFDWLKNNTPDPGLDYYALYDKKDFSYPSQAYGILARWDVGHDITYYSHRIPISNPFQQGMGSEDGNDIGEGTFFLETNEEKADEYLDELKAKYVIADYDSADPNGLFISRVKWVQGNFNGYWLEGENPTKEPNKFDNSMIARLYFLDGSEDTTERDVDGQTLKFYIKPLDHFRLVYESKTASINDELKLIKIFEYVKGAKITGKANAELAISINLKTNQDRELVYKKTISPSENGYFETIVPYEGSYTVKTGNKEKNIEVKEEDILNGKTIQINAFN
jgi:dolichyl-phosphooligosaccharide-protein glycotransferase